MDNKIPEDAIVLYPSPGIGHLVSMVELGKLILNHYANRFSITILLTTGYLDTPALAPYIRRVSAAYPAITFRRFPFQPVDTAPTSSRAAMAFEFVRLNRPNVVRALRDISGGGGKIHAFVIDLFCTSALDVGREMGIPSYYFFTSGAAVLAAFLHFPTVHERTTASFKDLKDVVLDFPGMPPLKAPHMPEPMLNRDDPAYWDLLYFCSHLSKSDGIIANTFDALEPIPINGALAAAGVCVPGAPAPKLYCIGPLIAEADLAETEAAADGRSSYLSWLDSQPSQSVVFLCFGSRGSFSVAQVKEVAEGLERSGQRFLWVVKKPPAAGNEQTKQTEDLAEDFEWDSGLFPEGFLERTRGRGVVVKSWVQQVAVLRKPAVGGFVTHCGWNSVLEAVAAGVPMVAWPLYAEQHMNRNVMVEDLKIAIAVEQREEDGFVGCEEVERSIRELMESERGRDVRRESLKKRDLASAAWGESGSSAVALDNWSFFLLWVAAMALRRLSLLFPVRSLPDNAPPPVILLPLKTLSL